MRLAPILAAAVVAGVTLGAQFRTGAEVVVVPVTVTDRDGRLVPDLTRDAFRVFDDGKPVAISTFSNAVQTITVALMLDMSGSMEERFVQVRESTFRFIEALLPWDRAAIGSFGHEIAISPMVTGDKAVLRRVVHEELWPGGGTPLWNAMDVAMSALAREGGRRVILLLTDGADTGHLPGHRAGERFVLRRARDEGFMIYAIGMEQTGLSRGMEELTDETGGGRFELKSDADLSATFARVAEELRRQYFIGFNPISHDGKEHRLEVRLNGPGLTARARRSYRAPRAPRR